MRFKLVENINHDILYHGSLNDFDKFRINEQGIHLSETKEGAYYVMHNREIENHYLYTVKLLSELKPLYIDLDPMDWGAPTIAKLLIAKITNKTVSGASGKDYYDSEQEIMTNYKYNISPELIHIDNLTANDLQYLKPFLKDERSTFNFARVSRFIERKGFNSIIYPLAEDVTNNEKAIIIWDPNMIEIINKEYVQ